MYRPEVGSNAIFKNDIGLSDYDMKKYKDFFDKEVEVIGYNKCSDGDEVVTFWEKLKGLCAVVCYDNMFSPLKSKRDEEIEEMCVGCVCSNSPITKTICADMYDKGYRKQMPYSQLVSIIQVYISKEFGYNDKHSLRCATELAAKLNRTPDEE